MSRPFPDPTIMLAPNVPKPLHTVTPREILGKKWWDEVRKASYATHDHHCWACGVHKSQARRFRRLEAHENYAIDYAIGRAELQEVVALCNFCHSFIHDGRSQCLAASGSAEMSIQTYLAILEHGNRLIDDYLTGHFPDQWESGTDLKQPFKESEPFQLRHPQIRIPGLPPLTGDFAPWQEWHLVVEGNKHYSPFKSFQHWQDHFAEKNRKSNVTSAFGKSAFQRKRQQASST